MTKPACLSLSILELAKIVMYEFWYDYIKPGYEKKKKKPKQSYVTFTQTLHRILKQNLIVQSMNWKYHYLKEKDKK